MERIPSRFLPISSSLRTAAYGSLLAAGLSLSPASLAVTAQSPSINPAAFSLRGDGPVQQAIELVRVRDGKALYSYQADTPLCPASVTKLVTSAAMLHYFGPTHTFSTRVYAQGARRGQVLDGNLIVVGDGDPLLVSESLWQIAADLKNLGLVKITGKLLLDNQLFDAVGRDASRLSGLSASNHAYDAPVSALGVNFNTYAVAIAPADQVGKPGYANLDPYPLPGVTIENRLVTVAGAPKGDVEVTRVSLPNGRSRLVVAGRIGLQSPLRKIYRSVNDPLLSAGDYMRAFFAGQGIQIGGATSAGRLPADAKLLVKLDSEPLTTVIRSLNHYSNNYIADVLVKRLGAAFPPAGAPAGAGAGSYAHGMHLISEFLRKEVGWQGAFTLANGSGLATENRVQARQITQLLVYMGKRWDLFPDYVASLPNAGLSGSLAKRFRTGPGLALRGQLRAKTGTLTEPFMVSALAGYFYHPEHELVAFTVLQNGQAQGRQPNYSDLHASQERGLGTLFKSL